MSAQILMYDCVAVEGARNGAGHAGDRVGVAAQRDGVLDGATEGIVGLEFRKFYIFKTLNEGTDEMYIRRYQELSTGLE